MAFQQFTSLLALNITATAALTANRFATILGAVPGAGAAAAGVARTNAAIGEMVAVDSVGTTVVECGAAVAQGAIVEADAQGRAITRTSGVALGQVLQGNSAAAAGDKVQILLTIKPA